MKLSVVIPFYNEERNVSQVLAATSKALDDAKIDYELIAVDNGSKDRTSGLIMQSASGNRRIRYVSVPKNLGYGHGILTGLGKAKGEFIGWMDGDLQVSPEGIVELYQLAEKHRSGIFKARRSRRHDNLQRKALSILYNHLSSFLIGVKSRDINAKPKLFPREAYSRMGLKSKDWFIDTELLMKATRQGLQVYEIEVDFVKRKMGKSKVSYRTAFEFLGNLIKARLGRL